MLLPHQEITMFTLSGDVPKREGVIKTLSLELGPTTMRDKLVVETSDHAKLTLSVSYKWQFIVDKQNEAEGNKMFLIKDFVGDACKSMASRIRGYVSTVPYKTFSESYQQLIQDIILKKDANGKRQPFIFKANNLMIDDVNCDEGIVPVDKSIEESLNRSLSQSFEIQNRA
jgi:major vault protein